MSLLAAHDNLGSPRVDERQRVRAAAPASTPSLPRTDRTTARRRVLGREEPGGPRVRLRRVVRTRAVRADVPGSTTGRAHTRHHNSRNNTNLDEWTVALLRIYTGTGPRGLGRARRVPSNTRINRLNGGLRPRVPSYRKNSRRAGDRVAHNNLTLLESRRPLGPVINQRFTSPRIRFPH